MRRALSRAVLAATTSAILAITVATPALGQPELELNTATIGFDTAVTDPGIVPIEPEAPAPEAGPEPAHEAPPAPEQPSDISAVAPHTLVLTGSFTATTAGWDAAQPQIFQSRDGLALLDISGVTLPGAATLTVEVDLPRSVAATGDARRDLRAASDASPGGVLVPRSVRAATKAALPGGTDAMVNITPGIAGKRNIYTVSVVPTGASGDASQSPAAVQQLVADAAEYWRGQTNGRVDFRHVLHTSVAENEVNCTDFYATISAAWGRLELGHDIVPKGRDHIIVVLPASVQTSCGLLTSTINWHDAGAHVATVAGGSGPNGRFAVNQALGYQLGFGRADWLECRVNQFPDAMGFTKNYLTGYPQSEFGSEPGLCLRRAGGDVANVMGANPVAYVEETTGGNVSVPHLIRSGIYKKGTDYEVVPAGTTKTFTLSSLSKGSGLRGLMVQDADGGVFFLEYRDLTGLDAQYQHPPQAMTCYVLGWPQYVNTFAGCTGAGVRVLRWGSDQTYKPWQLDSTTPAGFAGDATQVIGRTIANIEYEGHSQWTQRMAWGKGETFRSRPGSGGVTFTVTKVSGGKATVKVTAPKSNPSLNIGDYHLMRMDTSEDYLRVGQELAVFVDAGTKADTLSYQWHRVNAQGKKTKLAGATSASYVIREEALGHELSVTVTAKRGGKTVSRTLDARDHLGWSGADFTVREGQIAGAGNVVVHRSSAGLTAEVSGWSELNLPFRYQWLRNGAPIKSATKKTYKPVEADRNALISVRVQLPATGWTGPAESLEPAESAPVPVTVAAGGTVTITNGAAPRVGQALTAVVPAAVLPPTTDPGAAQFTFQWLRDGKAIKKATAARYTPVLADKGKRLSVKVTVKQAGYLATTTTTKTGAKTALGQFTIQAGLEPTVTKGAWPSRKLTASLDKSKVAESGYTISWQWYRDDTKRKGKTKSTYTPVTADRGAHVWVSATLKKKGYASRTLRMTLPQSPGYRDWLYGEWSNAEALFSGDVKVGSTVTYSPGGQRYTVHGAIDASNVVGRYTLTPEQVESYQWYRDGKKIKGATNTAYTITAADRGKRLKLVVTSSYPGYIGFTRSSRETGRVGDAVLPDASSFNGNSVPSPALKYRSAAGGKVTLVAPQPGPISNAPAGFIGDNLRHLDLPRTYQWFKNGKAIKGATKPEYTISAKDAKNTYFVQIWIKQKGYTELYVPSTPAIVSLYGATKVSVSGEARVGKSLTATTASVWPTSRRSGYYGISTCPGVSSWYLWYVDAPSADLLQHCADEGQIVALRYQWLRNGKAIAGATGASYTPTSKDKGKKLSLRVTYVEVSGTYFPLVLTSKTVKVK